MIYAACMSHKFAPIELHLLARFGLITAHGVPSSSGRAQGMHKGFELADPTRVALRAQPFEHGDTVVQVVLLHPAPNLVFERIQFAHSWAPRLGRGGAVEVLAYRGPRDAERLGNLANGLSLGG